MKKTKVVAKQAKSAKSKKKPAKAKAIKKSANNRTRNVKKKIKTSDFGSEILKKNSSLLTRQNMDGTVSILDLTNEKFFFQIDGLAAKVWLALDGKTPLDKILKKSTGKLKGDPQLLYQKEILKFLSDLKKNKLIL
jgi:hypothetical protein